MMVLHIIHAGRLDECSLRMPLAELKREMDGTLTVRGVALGRERAWPLLLSSLISTGCSQEISAIGHRGRGGGGWVEEGRTIQGSEEGPLLRRILSSRMTPKSPHQLENHWGVWGLQREREEVHPGRGKQSAGRNLGGNARRLVRGKLRRQRFRQAGKMGSPNIEKIFRCGD